MSKAALLDANVLYPALLRDLLLQLSFDGLFRAHWSADIAEEWRRNLVAKRPELAAQITLTQNLMLRAIPDALVTGYERRIVKLTLPDPGDRHVLAAAITAAAPVIVTYNLKDFPAASLGTHGVEAVHPDAFLRRLALAMPERFLSGVSTCLSRLIRPKMTQVSYMEAMIRLRLEETVTYLGGTLPRWPQDDRGITEDQT